MKLPCPYCQESIEYDIRLVGQTISCSYCKRPVSMPPLSRLAPEYQEEYQEEQERKQKKLEAEELKRQKAERKRKAAEEAAERKALAAANRTQPKEAVRQWYFANNTRISPKGLWERFVYIFDLKFERYLTPQIIRIVWALVLLLSICALGLRLLTQLPNAAPQTVKVSNPQRGSQSDKIARLQQLIDQKTIEAPKKELSTPQTLQIRQEPRQPQFRNDEPPKAQPTPADPYANMSLDQLKAELDRIEREYPPYLTEMDFRGTAWFILFSAVAVLSCIIGLLICRVICEMFIVVFNIANSLGKIRDTLGQAQPSAPPPPHRQGLVSPEAINGHMTDDNFNQWLDKL